MIKALLATLFASAYAVKLQAETEQEWVIEYSEGLTLADACAEATGMMDQMKCSFAYRLAKANFENDQESELTQIGAQSPPHLRLGQADSEYLLYAQTDSEYGYAQTDSEYGFGYAQQMNMMDGYAQTDSEHYGLAQQMNMMDGYAQTDSEHYGYAQQMLHGGMMNGW